MKKPASKLTALEIEAILAAAGNVDAPATFECRPTEQEADRLLAAFESGMGKLRAKLAQMER